MELRFHTPQDTSSWIVVLLAFVGPGALNALLIVVLFLLEQ